MIPNTSGSLFDMRIIPEDKVTLRSGPERKPEVDYIISVKKEKEKLIMLIPLEIKHSPGNFMVHAKQLCSYISKVGTCPSFAGQTVVGILMDDSYYHLAFAACQDKEGKSLPLLFCLPLYAGGR